MPRISPWRLVASVPTKGGAASSRLVVGRPASTYMAPTAAGVLRRPLTVPSLAGLACVTTCGAAQALGNGAQSSVDSFACDGAPRHAMRRRQCVQARP